MKTSFSAVQKRFDLLLVSPRLPFTLALLASLLTIPSLWVGLQFDDYLLEKSVQEAPTLVSAMNKMFIFMDGDVEYAQKNMEDGTYPWFALPEGKVAFWRPLSALTHWVDFYFFPNQPILMHLQNILWFALSVFLVAIFYREFLPAPVAGLAALFFTIDDAHGYAVGWISNRNVLIASVLGVLSLLLYHRSLQTLGSRKLFLWLGSIFCFSLTLLSAEAGMAIVGYFLAYLLFHPKPSKRTWGMLFPHLLVFIMWITFYRTGNFGGWGTSYIDPVREWKPFLLAVIERIPVLGLGFFAYPPAELFPFITTASIKYLWAGTALGLMLLLARSFYPIVRQNKNLQFLLAGAGFSLFLIGSSLPANRLLFFMGMGGFAVLASYLMDVNEHGWLKRPLWFIHLFAAIVLLPIMAYSPKLFGNIEPTILSASIKPTVIVISAPSAFHTDFFRLIRSRYGAESPERVWNLGASLSSMMVYRQSENTLVIKASNGYISGFDTVFRGSAHPLQKRQVINLGDLQITVQDLTPDGRPATVVFEFAEPLQNDDYQWLIWESNRLVEWDVPDIGQSIQIP
ncbi:MAG: hypothetical protein U0V18_15705 [Anaerolineales bacterium]